MRPRRRARARRARRRRAGPRSRRRTGRSRSGCRRPGRSSATARCRCGWRTTRRSTSSRSASFISQLATGVPLRPSTPAPSGCVSGTSPLALNVVSTGAPSCSASATTSRGRRGRRGRRRSPVVGRPPPARSPGPARRRPGRPGAASSGRPGSRPAACEGWACTSSGSTRCATPRPSRACLTARAASSAWSLPDCTVVVEIATSRKTRRGRGPGRRRGRAPWTGTWPETATTGAPSSLASYSPVSRFVEPGPGDREAGGGTSGELAVGAGREGCGTLVADADVAQLAALLGPAQRVGEAEVGVADHPEDGVDAVRDQGLDEHVGDGAARGRRDPADGPGRRRRPPRPRRPAPGRRGARPGARAARPSPGRSRSRATGSAAAPARSSPRRAGRPGAGSGSPGRRAVRRSGSSRSSGRRRRRCGPGPRRGRPPADPVPLVGVAVHVTLLLASRRSRISAERIARRYTTSRATSGATVDLTRPAPPCTGSPS